MRAENPAVASRVFCPVCLGMTFSLPAFTPPGDGIHVSARSFPAAACLVLAVLLAGTSAAADPTDQTKALKYHKVLVKRPDPGYLFDRFYNTWLDHGTVEELGQFLERQVEQSKQTADHLLLAFFYSKQGNEVRALELLSAATDADPDNALAWFLKAETEARTLAFDAAIADLGCAQEGSTGREAGDGNHEVTGQVVRSKSPNGQSPEGLAGIAG